MKQGKVTGFRSPIDIKKVAHENGYTIQGLIIVALKEFLDKRGIEY